MNLDDVIGWIKAHKAQTAAGGAAVGVAGLALWRRHTGQTGTETASTSGAGYAAPAAAYTDYAAPGNIAGLTVPNTSATDIQNAVQDQINDAAAGVRQQLADATTSALDQITAATAKDAATSAGITSATKDALAQITAATKNNAATSASITAAAQAAVTKINTATTTAAKQNATASKSVASAATAAVKKIAAATKTAVATVTKTAKKPAAKKTAAKAAPKPAAKPAAKKAPAKAAPKPAAKKTSTPQYYTVKSGDNLSRIANKYGMSLAAIEKLNPLPNPNLIYPGQKIKVKA